MAEDWARQIGLDRRSQWIILLARRACPIWPARTRQNPRHPKSNLGANQTALDWLRRRTCKQTGVAW